MLACEHRLVVEEPALHALRLVVLVPHDLVPDALLVFLLGHKCLSNEEPFRQDRSPLALDSHDVG